MSINKAPPRARPELEEFLRSKREKIQPEEVGLSAGKRRRTPGLRREEVAALAGVGLVWYTWLEQGREINVSTTFLDNLSNVLKLNESEKQHLYLLVQQRLPAVLGQTVYYVPPLINQLLDDLPTRPSYILNLRWDVLAWNQAADRLFHFSEHGSQSRNFLWLLFTDNKVKSLINPYKEQATHMVNSFRRDYVKAPKNKQMLCLINRLKEISSEFSELWNHYDIHGPCNGVRSFFIDEIGSLEFEYYSLIVDVNQNLRMIYYAIKEESQNEILNNWIISQKSKDPPS
ncbi:helix-turn-helix transcriptional regulator [Xenorhabdus bovienii]|uniref:helix-turn-helix transcriptional regulator n=1 Tax=Xenorhabdus bovienii TaxID=40576 RepID=UPI0023B256FF|nr:helix-turn-helix transcriptional regulator [Xenorhabdus bovienii]MDE9519012.1 helix-turn-helix transcriptional regulator [Xenorhabdus bovienii]